MSVDKRTKAADRTFALFEERFGKRPEICTVAPGRVNLIGEHTDYNDGFVFPAAIDLQVWVCAKRTGGPSQLCSLEMGEGTSFDAATVGPGDLHDWTGYGAGVAWAIREKTHRPVPNIQAVVHGEVPIGSGVSSSAAIELAFGVAWNDLAGFKFPNRELAKLGRKCENQFVGVNSGIMDQMASAMGKADHALFLDTRTLQIRYAPVPSDLMIVLCDTGKQRALSDSAYNERRSECERACDRLGVQSLRDVNLEQLLSHEGSMEDVIFRRARHVVTENARCLQFVGALDSGDLDLVGQLMKGSHQSLRDDYEVSCPELDAMAESAWSSTGCVGARMTGAGFGGACVALARISDLPEFIAETAVKYKKRTGLGGNFIACRASEGARTLSRTPHC